MGSKNTKPIWMPLKEAAKELKRLGRTCSDDGRLRHLVQDLAREGLARLLKRGEKKRRWFIRRDALQRIGRRRNRPQTASTPRAELESVPVILCVGRTRATISGPCTIEIEVIEGEASGDSTSTPGGDSGAV